MDNLLIILGLLIISSVPVHASELFGRISTDPQAVSIDQPIVVSRPGIGTNEANISRPVVASLPTSSQASEIIESGPVTATSTQSVPPVLEPLKQVLGEQLFKDNCLVRDQQGRLFLIRGQYKKPLHSLAELANYPKQPIFQTTSQVLVKYLTREHLAGELIRQQGDVKVFALKPAGKHHVLNLAELAKDYFSLPIYNLKPEEMVEY